MHDEPTSGGAPPRVIAVSGASGLVGTRLIQRLRQDGHRVRPLVRRPPRNDTEIHWDPARGQLDAERLAGTNAVVHLAGENIATGRWTEEKKRRIRASRVEGTRLLCAALAERASGPRVLVSASAIGYYGDRGNELLTEDSPPGEGFLADVCRDWETATEAAASAGLRVVNARIGVVLSTEGGALAKMLTPFKAGLGGVVGSGDQFVSWIELDDLIGAFVHLLGDVTLSGPVNLVAPQPVTNRQLTKALGKVLRRPTIFPMPAFAARLAFGRMADDLLLASTRVDPQRLRAAGYHFGRADIESALQYALDRPTR